MSCGVCSITCSTGRKGNKSPIVCPGCQYTICVSCHIRWARESASQCANCRLPFSIRFVFENVAKSARKILLDDMARAKTRLEIARSPALWPRIAQMHRVVQIRRYQTELDYRIIDARRDLAKTVLQHKYDRRLAGNTRGDAIRRLNIEHNTARMLAQHAMYTLMRQRADTDSDRVAYVPDITTMRCCRSVQGCVGYLDEDAACVLCQVQTCTECRSEYGPDHACNPDELATVHAIAEETRLCPGCIVPIYKTSGCDRVWCPLCHTHFSWQARKITAARKTPEFSAYIRGLHEHDTYTDNIIEHCDPINELFTRYNSDDRLDKYGQILYSVANMLEFAHISLRSPTQVYDAITFRYMMANLPDGMSEDMPAVKYTPAEMMRDVRAAIVAELRQNEYVGIISTLCATMMSLLLQRTRDVSNEFAALRKLCNAAFRHTAAIFGGPRYKLNKVTGTIRGPALQLCEYHTYIKKFRVVGSQLDSLVFE